MKPWQGDSSGEPLGKSSLPTLGVLALAGQDTKEPRCTSELHCPLSGTSCHPLPASEAVLKA